MTELAQAAQNGFWLVQMMTPTFLPESGPALLEPIAPVAETAAATTSAASETQRVVLRVMLLRPFGVETIDERSRSGWCVVAWYEVGQDGDGAS